MKKWFFLTLISALPLFAIEEEELTWEDQGPNAQQLNHMLQVAIEKQDWWGVVDYADLLAYCFPLNPLAQESAFTVGEAFIHLDQLELANRYFTAYLNRTTAPKQFEKAIECKFWIAEQFFNGAKKRLFNSHKMPKWVSAKEDALQIYDEVILARPHSEMGAQSLLHKALIQKEFGDYKESLETLDLLIRRFPKHDLAAQAFVEKNRLYLDQCQNESLNPTLLDLAFVNLEKFKLAFPREMRIEEAEKPLLEIRESFAQNLLETGKFFQKTKKIPASIIYYTKVIAKYPETKAAGVAREKLEDLQAADQF
ncbi:MAG: outer membrane protein assembly factor BamD [Chlamydiia bacterium]|nr:outer membrane protein assembly factor BamD [Chlamydiia bacterium]